jgi:hypothetical protein
MHSFSYHTCADNFELRRQLKRCRVTLIQAGEAVALLAEIPDPSCTEKRGCGRLTDHASWSCNSHCFESLENAITKGGDRRTRDQIAPVRAGRDVSALVGCLILQCPRTYCSGSRDQRGSEAANARPCRLSELAPSMGTN